MRGRIFFLVLLFSMLLLGFGLSHKTVESQFNGKPTKRERTPLPNKPADVESVSFDREIVQVPCPPTPRPITGSDCYDPMTVEVTTIAKDAENDVLIYDYQVSGGKIVGTGAKVVWDLSGVQPGNYSIRVGVDDGCGFCGKSVTETIKVSDGCCCPLIPPPCYCPSIHIKTLPQTIQTGDVLYFTAEFEHETEIKSIKYRWTAAGGTIVAGQGTSQIKVKTNAGATENQVTATVEIEAEGLCADCPRSASETVKFTNR